MATRVEIQSAVDSKLAPIWQAIQDRQAGRARYWQGLLTHTVVPSDGVETPPDRVLTKPTDQAEGWSGLPLTLPMAIRVDVYDGPQGRGYSATASVTIAGRTYERCVHVGPEAWRAFGWRQQAVP